MIRIIGVGDIMPGGLLSGNGKRCADDRVLDLLNSADIRVGTLECALGNNPTYDPQKISDLGNVIYAKDADVCRLKELNINIVSLANNHFFDLGVEGALHTIDILDSEKISYCGAGKNLEEAGRPVVVEINNKKIAFLAFCDTDYSHVYMCTYATADSPGVNPMQLDYVKSEISKAKRQYDYVVVMAHWGTEHTYYPNISTKKMAKIMLSAGADLILGSHPHRVQPIVNDQKGSIAYSMGNFLFPERLIAPPKVTYYPEADIDYSVLPVTMGYPIVDTVTLKSLSFTARLGMIVVSVIDKGIVSSSYRFSYLDKQNCLGLIDSEKTNRIAKKIAFVGAIINTCFYSVFMRLIRLSNSIKKKLRH